MIEDNSGRDILTGIEAMIAEAIDLELESAFGIGIDALSGSEYAEIERVAIDDLVQLGIVERQIRSAAKRSIASMAKSDPKWAAQCRDAAKEDA
jgi:hypothetical protein